MDKKNQKNLTGCFFLCTSNKKKKIIDNKLDQIETIPNKNPAEKINSSLSIIPKIKEKDSYGNSPGELNNIDENPSTKNLNSSKLLKNTSKIDISNKDLTKSLEDEKKEINNEIDKKLESSLNYKEIPIQKIEKTIKNTSPQVIDGNIKLNNSHLKDSKEIIFQNKPDDSEISKSNRTSNSKINNDLKKSIVEMNKDTNKNDEKNEINIKNNKFNQKENPSMIDIKLESDSYKVNIIPLTKDNKIEDNQQINVLEHHDSNKEEEIDEFKDYKNESDNESICQKSVISSNILSHIKKTKSYLNQKYENVSTYSRSDTSMIINNDLDFQCQQSSSIKNYCNYLKTSTELSEFEVFNDNDRIHRYIETPKSSTVTNVITYLKQSNSKSLIEILQKKDKSIKHLNQKILKSKRSLDNFVEENKKLCTKIEKEEAEGERLRHVLNYLLSHRD